MLRQHVEGSRCIHIARVLRAPEPARRAGLMGRRQAYLDREGRGRVDAGLLAPRLDRVALALQAAAVRLPAAQRRLLRALGRAQRAQQLALSSKVGALILE